MSSSIIRKNDGIVKAGESIAADCKCCGCPVRLQSAPLTINNGLYAITADLTWGTETEHTAEIVCKAVPPFAPSVSELTHGHAGGFERGVLASSPSTDAIRVNVKRPTLQASFRRTFLNGVGVQNFPFGLREIEWPSYTESSACGTDCPTFEMQGIRLSCQANNSLFAAGQFRAKSPNPLQVSHEVIQSTIEWKYVGPVTGTTILTITANISASPGYNLDYAIQGFFSGGVGFENLGTVSLGSSGLPNAPPLTCTACHGANWGLSGTATFTKSGINATTTTTTVPIGHSVNAVFPALEATGQAVLLW